MTERSAPGRWVAPALREEHPDDEYGDRQAGPRTRDAAAAEDHRATAARYVGLTMVINGVDYRIKPNPSGAYAVRKAYRLSKPDGTAYDVARTNHGLTCDCPDFIFHRDGLDPDGCKHIDGVLASSLRRLTRPASALFRAGHEPYPASYPGAAGGRASIRSRFPAAFRLPAFASRVFLRPLGNWAFLAVGLPAGIPPDPIGVVMFRM